jgi:hypothetical protein
MNKDNTHKYICTINFNKLFKSIKLNIFPTILYLFAIFLKTDSHEFLKMAGKHQIVPVLN